MPTMEWIWIGFVCGAAVAACFAGFLFVIGLSVLAIVKLQELFF